MMAGGTGGAGALAFTECLWAQPASASAAHTSAQHAADLAMERQEVIWSDRNACDARGQEQNRVFLVSRALEQFIIKMVLGSEAAARGESEGPETHFFLDFQLKPPYI
jgi:hypothetical protein